MLYELTVIQFSKMLTNLDQVLDKASAYADTTKANKVLGWKAESTLDEAMESAWLWEEKIRK